MKTTPVHLLSSLPVVVLMSLMGAALSAEATGKYLNPYRAAPAELPPEVVKAKVLAETVVRDAKTGGSVTLQVVAPPVFAVVGVPAVSAVAATPLSLEEAAARRAAAPTQLCLFAPQVLVYPNGMSLVKWWNPDWTSPARELQAFVTTDLTSLSACGDLTVGKCRYLMMGSASAATARQIKAVPAPALADFKGAENILLVRGEALQVKALEPLHALLDAYTARGGLIASTYAQQRTLSKEQADWEKANPEPPPQAVIKFWPIQSSQYSTVVGK